MPQTVQSSSAELTACEKAPVVACPARCVSVCVCVCTLNSEMIMSKAVMFLIICVISFNVLRMHPSHHQAEL